MCTVRTKRDGEGHALSAAPSLPAQPTTTPAEGALLPAVRRVLTAGDTVRDLEAGMNAGAGFVVGVLSGSQTAEELGAARHTHLLSSVAEIPKLIQSRGVA